MCRGLRLLYTKFTPAIHPHPVEGWGIPLTEVKKIMDTGDEFHPECKYKLLVPDLNYF